MQRCRAPPGGCSTAVRCLALSAVVGAALSRSCFDFPTVTRGTVPSRLRWGLLPAAGGGTLRLRGGGEESPRGWEEPRYAWDQDPDEVRVYVFLEGILEHAGDGSARDERLTVDIFPTGLSLKADGLAGQNNLLVLAKLFAEVRVPPMLSCAGTKCSASAAAVPS
jgi:hypothetical protein